MSNGAQASGPNPSYRVVRELGKRAQRSWAAVREKNELVVVQRFTKAARPPSAALDGIAYDASGATYVAADAMGIILRDARCLSKNWHPNVSRVRHVDLVSEELTIATELVEGVTLADLITAARAKRTNEKDPILQFPLLARVIVDVLGGLHGLHGLRDGMNAALNVFHGELCPANIVVGKDGVARVAHAFRPRPVKIEASSEGLGYAAPETLGGEASQDARADIYSVGAMLWEGLTSRRLFEDADPVRVAQRQREEDLASPGLPSSSAFARLSEVAMRALAFDPSLRFRTASEMATDIRRIAGTRLAPGSAVAQTVMELAGDRIRARRTELDQNSSGSRRAFGAASIPPPSKRTDSKAPAASAKLEESEPGDNTLVERTLVDEPPPATTRGEVPVVIAKGAKAIAPPPAAAPAPAPAAPAPAPAPAPASAQAPAPAPAPSPAPAPVAAAPAPSPAPAPAAVAPAPSPAPAAAAAKVAVPKPTPSPSTSKTAPKPAPKPAEKIAEKAPEKIAAKSADKPAPKPLTREPLETQTETQTQTALQEFMGPRGSDPNIVEVPLVPPTAAALARAATIGKPNGDPLALAASKEVAVAEKSLSSPPPPLVQPPPAPFPMTPSAAPPPMQAKKKELDPVVIMPKPAASPFSLTPSARPPAMPPAALAVPPSLQVKTEPHPIAPSERMDVASVDVIEAASDDSAKDLAPPEEPDDDAETIANPSAPVARPAEARESGGVSLESEDKADARDAELAARRKKLTPIFAAAAGAMVLILIIAGIASSGSKDPKAEGKPASSGEATSTSTSASTSVTTTTTATTTAAAETATATPSPTPAPAPTPEEPPAKVAATPPPDPDPPSRAPDPPPRAASPPPRAPDPPRVATPPPAPKPPPAFVAPAPRPTPAPAATPPKKPKKTYEPSGI